MILEREHNISIQTFANFKFFFCYQRMKLILYASFNKYKSYENTTLIVFLLEIWKCHVEISYFKFYGKAFQFTLIVVTCTVDGALY